MKRFGLLGVEKSWFIRGWKVLAY